MYKKNYLSLSITVLLAASGIGLGSLVLTKASADSAVPYKSETVEIINPSLKAYLDASTSAEQFLFLNTYDPVKDGYYDKPVLPKVTFSGNNNGPYLVNISTDGFVTSRFITATSEEFIITSPIPGTRYEYEVSDRDNAVIARGEVNIKDDYGLRYMNITTTYNVRDEGGWDTTSGHKVKYGMMYRGARLNSGESIVDESQKVLYNEEMGIKSEIDLRNTSDDIGQRNAVFAEKAFGGYTKNYIRDFDHAFGNYDGFFDVHTRRQVGIIFNYLTDESNYPFYTHCSAGADRTGSICFTLNGLLGVSYDDLVKDFELTTFSAIGNRWRAAANSSNTDFDLSKAYVTSDGQIISFPKMIEKFRSFGTANDDIETCIYNFLTTSIEQGGCGVSGNDINIYRALMLGLERKVGDPRNVNETCTTSGVAVYEYEGNDLVVTTNPLKHNFLIGQNHVVCTNCHESYVAQRVDIDASKEFDFGTSAVKAIMSNGDEITLENGKVKLNLNYAFNETTTITVVTSAGNEVIYIANIYSTLINTVGDLFNISKNQVQCLDSDGNVYYYGNYKLNNDLVLSDNDLWSKTDALGYSKVTSSKTGFKGVFDGDNHTINNFVTSGQDGALIYSLAGGTVKNLILEGRANDSYWGNDFLAAYTYSGTVSNINIRVELANGSLIYHNTALLGTIGYNEELVDDININNVSIEGVNSSDVLNSNAIGMLFKNHGLNYGFNGHLKISGLRVSGINNLLVYYAKNIFNYEVISDLDTVRELIGVTNIDNLSIQ